MDLMKRMLNGLAVVLLSILILGCGEKYEAPSHGSKLALSNGWKIYYKEQGHKDAPVILFLHGLGGSSEYWDKSLASPEMKKYRCLAIDMIGFGYSDKPKDFDYSMEKHAETIKEFLALKKVNKVTFIAHSMGGNVGIELAQMQGDLIKKLVLVDTILALGKDGKYVSKINVRLSDWGEWRFRLVFPILKLFAKKLTSDSFEDPKPEIIDMASRAMKQSAYYAFHRSLKDLYHHAYKDEKQLDVFKKFKIPHYYIYGTTDKGVALMAEDLFGSKPWVHAIKGVKHCPMVEDHARFCSILTGILAE